MAPPGGQSSSNFVGDRKVIRKKRELIDSGRGYRAAIHRKRELIDYGRGYRAAIHRKRELIDYGRRLSWCDAFSRSATTKGCQIIYIAPTVLRAAFSGTAVTKVDRF
jgi:hypothetical protein